MSTACCSNECEKKFECVRHYLNVEGDCYVEDYSHFGTGTYTDNRCEIEHWCGELGDYKMFEPIEKVEEKILFPFQYLEAYLLGEMSFDASVDSTIKEFDKLMEEYMKKHKILTGVNMYKKKHIDFILYEDEDEVLVFRFYPRKSSCHSFDEELPTKWEEVYKVYYSYSIFKKYKDDNYVDVLLECSCDECSVIDEVAARIALIVKDKERVTNSHGYIVELLNNEIYPIGCGISWEIRQCRNFDAYEIMMWQWDDTGYRFTLGKNKLKDFGLYLQECCEYMLAHGDPI